MLLMMTQYMQKVFSSSTKKTENVLGQRPKLSEGSRRKPL